jgi:RalA-binding protein 1
MSTSVSSTPTKDKPAPSSSRSNTQLPATSRPPPASVQALLSAHASASDPAQAALEQALLEWSTLSSQNAQLWKLIDKQRTGYNQLLKELERLRSERDSYRSRLHALDGTSDSRRHRTPKTSLSGSSSSELPYTSPHSRMPLARHQSDDPRMFLLIHVLLSHISSY